MLRSLPITIVLTISSFAACTDASRTPADGGRDGGSDSAVDADSDRDGDDMDGSDADDPGLPDCGYGAAPRGVRVGQVFYPVHLWSCDGETVSVAEVCCAHEVTIVHLSTMWCTVCETATTMLQRNVMAPLEGEPVALIELLLEEGHGEVATLAGCELWSERFEPPAPTYVPRNGDISDELYVISSVGAPPVTFLLDSEGEIRWRSNTALPDRLDEEQAQLLQHAREILAED